VIQLNLTTLFQEIKPEKKGTKTQIHTYTRKTHKATDKM